MTRTVYLHVGIAKTGTTYLQRTLYANRALLERHGTRYPGPGPAAHFLGSLDLRGTTFQGHAYPRAEGAWDRLVARADAYDGNALISHETLAHANADHVRRAVTSFATDDVRVVVTCRDLARQIPATWQETLKNRSATPYATFVSKVVAEWPAAGGPRGPFWRAQHVEGLVERWAAAVGPANVKVVTVPPSGADPLELWRRFARASELPDVDYTFAAAGGNSSLGVAEAEMLRRLNPLLDDLLDWPTYDELVKKGLAVDVLGPLKTLGKLGLPPSCHADVLRMSDSSVAFLARSGVPVIGDAEDLRPDLTLVPTRQPEDLADADVLDVALQALAALLGGPGGVVPRGDERKDRSRARLARRLRDAIVRRR